YITNLTRALQVRLRERLRPIRTRFAARLGAARTMGDRARTLARDLWWHQVVVTIHDLAVLRFPEMFRPWQGGYARWVLPRLARRARAVITGSAATKADLV